MAAVENTFSRRIKIHLNNGKINGIVRTIPVDLENLSCVDASFDLEKVSNIVSLLENCFSKEVHEVEHVKYIRITDE